MGEIFRTGKRFLFGPGRGGGSEGKFLEENKNDYNMNVGHQKSLKKGRP